MHAVLVSTTLTAEAMEFGKERLREDVVPRVAAAPGFLAAYWLEAVDGKGLAVVVFETEEHARDAAPAVGTTPAPGAAIDSVDFRAVVASA